ncbi:NUDIX hydrolase [Brytella acorum]|uniref:NUDIX hydrolase N-terminal domain-containing protein n=1 Tax=Brytella acorum TaxID=2959299 RepID=A0AA35VBD5_9PROT|nr:NUDIX hydrolase N-terminal domain-containing protein [Brytella acorum]MDF3625439.1 NUDIX hydrolase N-terminal domain-containing protein [Brytella acorum]CAI9120290.1 NUDIX hydrolase N-terminal domain-containing protein [Brytella acorum]
MTEPDWLRFAREMQAIAQSGLAFSRDVYDRERYVQLRDLASHMMSAHVDAAPERITRFFTAETGYATPKVDVRVALFNPQGQVLMVREKIDEGRWTFPGGWADVNLTPAQNALKELREESGFEGRILKLAAVWDRNSQGHDPDVFSIVKLFFVGVLTGGEARESAETSGVGWFHKVKIPLNISTARILPHQVVRMFEHWENPGLPTDFE